eukprot:Nk52_evm35s292 gene=Nk52_evmTU35s292
MEEGSGDSCSSGRLIDYFFVCGIADEEQSLKNFKVSNGNVEEPCDPCTVEYPAGIKLRVPAEDYPDFAFPSRLAEFCFQSPKRRRVQRIVTTKSGISGRRELSKQAHSKTKFEPSYSSFALTEENGSRFYCFCLTFYEPPDNTLLHELVKKIEEYNTIVKKRFQKKAEDLKTAIRALAEEISHISTELEEKSRGLNNEKLKLHEQFAVYEEEEDLCSGLENRLAMGMAELKGHKEELARAKSAIGKLGEYLDPLLNMNAVKRKSSITNMGLFAETQKTLRVVPGSATSISTGDKKSASCAAVEMTSYYFASPVVIGFVSHLPYLSLFRDSLCQIFMNYIKALNMYSINFEIPPHLDFGCYPEIVDLPIPPANTVFSMINKFTRHLPVPPCGKTEVKLNFDSTTMYYSKPPVNFFPFELNNFSLRMICELLSAENIILVVRGLLLEKKIVLASYNEAALHLVSETLLSLIYPFKWHYTYIPTLPSCAIDVLDSPSPYFVGCSPDCVYDCAEEMEPNCPDDAILVDLDRNKSFADGVQDFVKLPQHVERLLMRALEVVCCKNERPKYTEADLNGEQEVFPKKYSDCFTYPFIDSTSEAKDGREMQPVYGCYFSKPSLERKTGNNSLSKKPSLDKDKKGENEDIRVEVTARGSDASDPKDSSRKTDSAHRFVLKRFTKGTICSLCSEQVTGITNNGFMCHNCGCIFHKKCLEGAKEIECGSFNEVAIRWEFLKIFSIMMKNYRNFFRSPEEVVIRSSADENAGLVNLNSDIDSIHDVFRAEEFISNADKELRPFLSAFAMSYCFLHFVVYRMDNPETNYDILFFDDYMKWRKKKPAVFLQDENYGFNSVFEVDLKGGDGKAEENQMQSRFLSLREMYIIHELHGKMDGTLGNVNKIKLLSNAEEDEMKAHTQSIIRRVNLKKKKKKTIRTVKSMFGEKSAPAKQEPNSLVFQLLVEKVNETFQEIDMSKDRLDQLPIADIEKELLVLYGQHSNLINAADVISSSDNVAELQTTLKVLVDRISTYEELLREKKLILEITGEMQEANLTASENG